MVKSDVVTIVVKWPEVSRMELWLIKEGDERKKSIRVKPEEDFTAMVSILLKERSKGFDFVIDYYFNDSKVYSSKHHFESGEFGGTFYDQLKAPKDEGEYRVKAVALGAESDECKLIVRAPREAEVVDVDLIDVKYEARRLDDKTRLTVKSVDFYVTCKEVPDLDTHLEARIVLEDSSGSVVKEWVKDILFKAGARTREFVVEINDSVDLPSGRYYLYVEVEGVRSEEKKEFDFGKVTYKGKLRIIECPDEVYKGSSFTVKAKYTIEKYVDGKKVDEQPGAHYPVKWYVNDLYRGETTTDSNGIASKTFTLWESATIKAKVNYPYSASDSKYVRVVEKPKEEATIKVRGYMIMEEYPDKPKVRIAIDCECDGMYEDDRFEPTFVVSPGTYRIVAQPNVTRYGRYRKKSTTVTVRKGETKVVEFVWYSVRDKL